jgi:hypothetical protein
MLHASAGELHANTALILVDTLEIPAEMVARFVDGRAQKALQAVPGGQYLPQRPLVCDATRAVDGDALGHLDAEHIGAGAARFQRLQQFGMPGDAGAATDQLDIRALVDIHVPSDLAQECRGKKPRHRAANNDSPSVAAARGSPRHGRTIPADAALSIVTGRNGPHNRADCGAKRARRGRRPGLSTR